MSNTFDAFVRNNLSCSPRRVLEPSTPGELRAELVAAARSRQPVKVAGDGWGFSNAAFTSGVLLPTARKLKRILQVEPTELRPGVDASGLLRFEAGATIEELNAHLTPRGRALMNQPGFAKLTWVGTMMAGGHGSGMWTGPLSSHAAALRVLTIDATSRVVELQLEPSSGISDPRRFALRNPGVRLVQDDHLFRASVCGLGCLGVVSEVTVRTQPAFFLRESRRRMRWEELKPLLPSLLADQGPGKRLHSVEVWLNPYPVKGELWAVLGEREWANGPARGSRPLGIRLGGSKLLLNAGLWWFRNFPSLLPGGLHSALGTAQAEGVVMAAPEALDFGNVNHAPMMATNTGVPTDGVEALLDDACAWLQRRFAAKEGFVTSPLGLRFIQGTDAYLSPAYGRDSCMIEVPTLVDTPNREATQRAFQQYLFSRGGRPHWGLLNYVEAQQLPSLLPALHAFLDAHQQLDPTGAFDNALTEDLRLRSMNNHSSPLLAVNA